jgi:photosystem II stability/assembly factor-like uncharacterized protein
MKRIFAIGAIFWMVCLAGGLVYPPSSSSFAVGSWSELGPAPTVNGSTDYIEPSSGRITGIGPDPVDPKVIYLATAGGGVWKTMNGGLDWTPLTETQGIAFMGAIAVAPSAPSTIYAGAGEANMGPSKARNFRDNIYYGTGVLKSVNGGSSWTLLGAGQFFRSTISRIVVDPANADVVYVAVGASATNGRTDGMGIWKSTNGGMTWSNTTSSTVPQTVPFSDLAMDPANAQTLYAGAGAPGWDAANGVYKTTNGGATWALLPFPPPPFSQLQVGRIALAISTPLFPGGPGRLYAALTRPGPPNASFWSLYRLLRSGDGGSTWEELLSSADQFCPEGGAIRNYLGNAGDYHSTLAVDPLNPDNVYAAGLCLIRSQSGGDVGTWETIAPGATEGPHRDHHALVFDAFGSLLDGNDGGIWSLDDPLFVTWSNLNGNLRTTQFVGMDLHPTNASIAYGGTQDTGTVNYQGTPQWPRLLRGDGGATAVSNSNPMRVYQVTRISSESTSAVFRRSDDGGGTWAAADLAFRSAQKNFYFPVQMSPTNSHLLLVGTTNVLESTNGGDTWTVIGGPGISNWPSCTSCDNIDSLAMDPSDSTTTANTIYVSAGAHIFVTFDHGATWGQRDIGGVGNPHFRSLLVDPANKLVAYAVRDRFDGGHVFQTSNGGLNWTNISGNLRNLPVNAIVLDKRSTPGTLYVGTDAGVYVSTNQGVTWARFGTGFPDAQVVDLKLNTTLNILAAGTHGRGMWEISLSAALRPSR